MRHLTYRVVSAITASLFAAVISVQSVPVFAASEGIDQQVRLLLSNRCFACHGPDENERQGGFRLDVRDSFLAEADSGDPPVLPGNPEESELLRRVASDDPGERMPPPEFGAAFSSQETELLRRWIADGAKFPMHWSFVPPVRPPNPEFPADSQVAAAHPGWLKHPVDRFVLEQQLARDLQPSWPATKAELLRRVSLDLTGLPPTPEQVARFEQDASPGAYERQVDRLLASPAYGEHWARKWLDLARYADSAGYADDPPRTIWAYRDWVIQALNEDMAVDEFTVRQLAGDLLPDATPENVVATAFHRNTLTNNEGGTNDEEFRNVAIVDRVNTTMAVWMGVTMACAQCHTHKYDPFTQEEYFKLFAIFNQSQDADRKDESPTVDLFTPEQRRTLDAWQQLRQQLEQQLDTPTAETNRQLAAWEEQMEAPEWCSLKPLALSSKSKSNAEFGNDGTIRVQPTGNNIVTDTYTLSFELGKDGVQTIHAFGLRTIPDETLPRKGAGLGGGNFVVTDVTGELTPLQHQAANVRFVRVELPGREKILSLAEVQVFAADENLALTGSAKQSSTDYGGSAERAIDGNTSGNYDDNSTTHTEKSKDPWWELDLGSEYAVERLTVWNRTGGGLHERLNGARISLMDDQRKVVFSETLERASDSKDELAVRETKPVHFIAAYADYSQPGFPGADVVDGDKTTGWAVEGQIASSHLLVLVPEEPLQVDGAALLKLEIGHNSSHRHHLVGSFRLEASGTPGVADWAAMNDELRRIQSMPAAERTQAEQTALSVFFARELAPANDAVRKELAQLERKMRTLKPATSAPIMREVAPNLRRETFIQIRGNYKSLGDQVEAGAPAVFHPLDAAPEDVSRLTLAEWLVDRRNPLTARVWMNRMWESLFGIGIVRSSEDFGAQGDRPTHPALLDWLAVELMESGWDQKRLLRLLVTSHTYRQTSQVSADDYQRDKDNIWLARGPRVRLSAEMVRDQALAAAGLLSNRMFGEPVRPPQPNMGLTAAFGSATDWKASEGEDRYRRGIYTSWRRSNPYPSMVTFDAPSREVCTLRRDVTNTPLQALVTMNDPAFFEAAQALARRVIFHEIPSLTDEQQIERAFRLCTNRAPEARELRALCDLLNQLRGQLESEPESAQTLATEPIGPLPPSADAVELAAFSSLCNVLLNLDEVLMKR